MFIKKLIISSPTEIIRDIDFKSGLNLIIDDTPTKDTKKSGNNVGKTTVLKLVDVCLGKRPDIIYEDTENKKETYALVKDFLINQEVEITLVLTENLNDIKAKQLEIKRNFLKNKKALRKINDELFTNDKEFEAKLEEHIIPNKGVIKPTFRQIISHNIRYKDEGINNTLKTLDKYTSDVEYETLYLYLLGANFKEGDEKQTLVKKVEIENNFKKRLEKKQSRVSYEMALDLIHQEINSLEEKKASFNLNKTFDMDLELLNNIKYKINKISSQISNLEIRKNLIEESIQELEENISSIDLQQLRILYDEVAVNISNVQKTFEDLVNYHNKMVVEKVNFISQDMPVLVKKLKFLRAELRVQLKQEKELTDKIAKGDSFGELEKIISELNEKYRLKGEYETVISQIKEVEENLKILNNQIEDIDNYIFSDDFEEPLKNKVKKFNKFFSEISNKLYGEQYALTFEKTKDAKGRQFYKFSAFHANMSSGKKQGEILCFDLAYLLFADEEKLPCLHFLLNDKKELMHDNQLIEVANFVKDQNIQLIISILKDKLPDYAIKNAHVSVELSQKNKLFKIERNV